MIDLVKRLRTMAATGWSPIGDEAADIITALRAENERLRRSRDRYRKAWEEEKRRFTEARAALGEPENTNAEG